MCFVDCIGVGTVVSVKDHHRPVFKVTDMKIDKQLIVHVAVTSLPMKTFLAAVARALGLRLVKLTQLLHANMVVMDKDETDCVLTTAYAAATHLKKPGKIT